MLKENETILEPNIRFISSYARAKIVQKDSDLFQLHIQKDSKMLVYTHSTFKDAYNEYNSILERDYAQNTH